MKKEIKNLKEKGFVSINYPEKLLRPVEIAVKSWKRFCDLPLDVKTGLPYSNGGAGVGYEFKEGIGNKADKKENFDTTLAGQDWIEENVENIHNPLALDFVRNSTNLIGLLKPLITDFAKQIEKEFKIHGFVKEVEKSEDAYFVRFIHYFGDRELKEETASAHVDQSGFTFHIFESDKGLQCLTYAFKWKDMPVSNGQTVIIPSMQLQLRSKGVLRALCHRVIANEKTAKDGRYSAVCFIQLKNTPKYDKDRCGRLQEKEPGFNYSMPIKEFSKLFKK
jgi:isopenicillin N synthase-like dioxygenase